MKEITVEAKDENLQQVMGFIEEVLEAEDCSMKTSMQIQLAVEELFINIAHYAYVDKTGEVTISISISDDRAAEITFTDSGIPYDPLQKEDPDITKPSEERPIGGLGIFMVKKSMDRMYYRYENSHNILTIVKKI